MVRSTAPPSAWTTSRGHAVRPHSLRALRRVSSPPGKVCGVAVVMRLVAHSSRVRNELAANKISLARLSSRFSGPAPLIRAASLLVVPGSWPDSLHRRVQRQVRVRHRPDGAERRAVVARASQMGDSQRQVARRQPRADPPVELQALVAQRDAGVRRRLCSSSAPSMAALKMEPARPLRGRGPRRGSPVSGRACRWRAFTGGRRRSRAVRWPRCGRDPSSF